MMRTLIVVRKAGCTSQIGWRFVDTLSPALEGRVAACDAALKL
jgi:hypothetical protein